MRRNASSSVRLFGVALASFMFAAAAHVAIPDCAFADDAKAHYEQGVTLYGEGDYQAALIEFKRSYEVAPNFSVLYNIGQTYFQLKDYANALKTLQQYLEEGGKRVGSDRRESVERDLAQLKGRVATLTVKVNVEGAELKIDDAVVAAPISGPVLVSSGKHKIEVSKPGYKTITRSEEFAGQEQRELALELQPEIKITDNGDKKVVIIGGDAVQEPGPPIGPIVLWTLTGVLAISTGAVGGVALGAASDLQDLKTEPGTSESAIDDQADQANTLAIAADVLLGVTILSAVGAVIFTAIEIAGSDDKPAAKTTQLLVGPGFVGVETKF